MDWGENTQSYAYALVESSTTSCLPGTYETQSIQFCNCSFAVSGRTLTATFTLELSLLFVAAAAAVLEVDCKGGWLIVVVLDRVPVEMAVFVSTPATVIISVGFSQTFPVCLLSRLYNCSLPSSLL